LEVAQIARTVAAALGLNTDLVETLALAHDIGHPPFGHSGESKLNQLMQRYGEHFNHNLHALRIVEQFEHRYLDFSGLNLTFEVREGIVKHSHDYTIAEAPELSEYLLDLRPPLESQLIDWVDEIAYNTADLDDALEANLLNLEALCHQVPFFGEIYLKVEASHPHAKTQLKFNDTLRQVVDLLVSDLITNTEHLVEQAGVRSVEDIRHAPQRLGRFSDSGRQQNVQLKRSIHCLEELFAFYLKQPRSMPESFEEMTRTSPRHVIVCDYIAGMTDQFLLRQHHEHLGSAPSPPSPVAHLP
jgi:dGTPase